MLTAAGTPNTSLNRLENIIIIIYAEIWLMRGRDGEGELRRNLREGGQGEGRQNKKKIEWKFFYFPGLVQHCFICSPPDSTLY
jgi:hypothetical protein